MKNQSHFSFVSNKLYQKSNSRGRYIYVVGYICIFLVVQENICRRYMNEADNWAL